MMYTFNKKRGLRLYTCIVNYDSNVFMEQSYIFIFFHIFLKIQNDSYHKVFQIDTQQLHKFKNPNWEVALEKLVTTVAYKLGVNPCYLTAQLDMLL